MKRYFDYFIEFAVYTHPHDDEYSMIFSTDCKFSEMLDYLCNHFEIDPDTIHEIRTTYVKRYKVTKDD